MSVIAVVLAAMAALIVLPWDTTVIPGPIPRINKPTLASQPLDEPEFTRQIVKFPCSGLQCEAWLYLPKQPIIDPPPIVVMAHGLGAQKDMGLESYAARFAAAGLAAFVFDYRTFGGSDGEPRHHVSPSMILADWRSAVAYIYANLTAQVDTSKLLLWGTSFAGGHVLVIGAELGDNVTAIASQVRWLSLCFQQVGSCALVVFDVVVLAFTMAQLSDVKLTYHPATANPGCLFPLLPASSTCMQWSLFVPHYLHANLPANIQLIGCCWPGGQLHVDNIINQQLPPPLPSCAHGHSLYMPSFQVPFMDGRDTLKRQLKMRGPITTARGIIAGLHDVFRTMAGLPAAYYPLVAPPGVFAYMNLNESEMERYYSKHPKDGYQVNPLIACCRI